MSVFTKKAEPARRVVAIRATEEERRILMEAAKREHRSRSSCVLRDRSTRTPETIEAALTRAQEIMSKYRKPGHSFVDEFLAEKRAEAARERY
jgi:uncharacterized protein (DUF1778 family)